MSLRVRNWARFQHYGKRQPPWIKLYRSLLDDFHWHCLSDASKALAPCIWLLASENADGSVTDDANELAHRLRATVPKTRAAVKELIFHEFLEGCLRDASTALALREQSACLETETETEGETEGETDPPIVPPSALANGSRRRSRSALAARESNVGFDRFWDAYPRRKGKAAAVKAWRQLDPDPALTETILAAVTAQREWPEWRRDAGQYVPYPATWLNRAQWCDERDPAPVAFVGKTAGNLAAVEEFLRQRKAARGET